MMAKTGLLILTNPIHIAKILPTISKQVKNTLYIHLINALQEPFARYRPDIFTSTPKYSQTIRGIYSQAAALCDNLDVRVLLSSLKYTNVKTLNTSAPIDLVIFDKTHEKTHIDTFLNKFLTNKQPTCEVLVLKGDDCNPTDIELDNTNGYKEYTHVVLGGTFDRLHTGHKMLLSEAILRAQQKVTVGVTDTNMLNGKILWSLIEPIETRLKSVESFVNDVCPEINTNIVPIQDAFGPTQSDETMELIVVSAETLRGGEKVNEIRKCNGLKPLDIVTVELVDCPDRTEEEEAKISSSTGRMRMLGTLLKQTKPSASLPYIIGLTGGIASGKTSISQRLAKLGAVVIDCDKIAHELYQKGKPCHKIIHEAFGDKVIDTNGEINRKALGAIVFHNKDELSRLNSLVWPAIAAEVQQRIDALKLDQRCNVIVIEAAVLLQAKWDQMCNEVWTSIIPPEEAIVRLKTRNGLSETDAKARLASQPPNTDHVTKAHVVLCTLWSFDYTQRIVERAWKQLMLRMPKNDRICKQEDGDQKV